MFVPRTREFVDQYRLNFVNFLSGLCKQVRIFSVSIYLNEVCFVSQPTLQSYDDSINAVPFRSSSPDQTFFLPFSRLQKSSQ